MQLKAVFVRIVNTASGQGKNGPWAKQEFITETRGPKPRTVCLTAWNEKGDILSNLAEGEALTIDFEPESKEYNNRWYNENRVFGITVDATGESTGSSTAKPTAKKAVTPVHTHTGNNQVKPAERRGYAMEREFADEDNSDLPF